MATPLNLDFRGGCELAKLITPSDFSNINDPNQFMRFCSQFINELVDLINGKLEFDKNIKTQTVTATFTSSNADMAISHSLNKSVVYYFPVKKNISCDVFSGVTANTTNTLYLQCTQISTVTLILF